ncbi:ATP-grasp domain-containing protein [Prodigiosinella confusarubida]|nr:ATP-grasp domain-containing protein [Serratia sp. ATCC 39006]
MAKVCCLVIGNVREGEYEGLLAQGVTILLLSDTKQVTKKADPSKIQPVASYDFSKGYSEDLQQLVNDLYQQYAFSSVLNYRESYVAITEHICRGQTELSHMHQNISITLDKTKQRACFNRSSNPDLHVMSRTVTMSELLQQAATLTWPCVLKPASLYSSLFVKCLHSNYELERYSLEEWPELQAYVANKSRENDVLLLEEYLEGSNHSIDCVISADGKVTTFPIVDVIAGIDIQRNDFHHFARYSPSILQPDQDQMERCHKLACDAVAALGLRGTFAHVEFIMTVKGPRILEVGARPGGSRIYVIREAWGIEMDYYYHCVLAGNSVPKKEILPIAFGIATPFARHNRPWQGLQHEELLRRIPGFVRWDAWVKEGEIIGPASNGFQNYVYAEFRCSNTSGLRTSLLEVTNLDVFGELQKPAVIIVGGRDSSLNWPGNFAFDFTFVQTPDQLTEYQRHYADIILTNDITDIDSWLPQLLEYHEKRPFVAIVSFTELGLLPAAKAGEQLGILHNPRRSVELSRDKLQFRELMSASCWALPASKVNSAQQALEFIKQHGPAIIKPVDGSGSKGIYAVNKAADLCHIVFDGNQQIEQFVEGDEFSVETLTLNSKHHILGITRKYTTGTPHYVETGHDFPASLPPEDEQRIHDAVKWLLDALGHQWGPAHTEVKISGDTLHFIETQTRFGGDQIWEMVWRVTGIHQAGATIAAMAGQKLTPDHVQFDRMAIRFITNTTVPRDDNPWLFRTHIDRQKIGRPVQCSSDRYGYYLYGCSEEDGVAFVSTLSVI